VNGEEKQQENGRDSEEKRRKKKTCYGGRQTTVEVVGEQWPPAIEVDLCWMHSEGISKGKQKEKKQ